MAAERQCDACPCRGVERLSEDQKTSWEVCRHADLLEIYDGGRALEHGAPYPPWCPQHHSPRSKKLNKILPEKEIKITWVPDARGFRVTVVHHKSQLTVTLAGEHSLYFTRVKAIKKLADKLREWEALK